MTFVFLHVGPDLLTPTLLVRSIRKLLPDAEIIQCADAKTMAVAGVTAVHRQEGDINNLMTFRLACFDALGLDKTAAYLDTDVLMIRPVDPARVLGDNDVAVCKRSFGREDTINTSFKGMDLSEYTNKTFEEIYPYVACFTVTRSHAFWCSCREELLKLDEKFHYWYGDQEAIRNIVRNGVYRVNLVPESTYGCLPENLSKGAAAPRLLHFKGSARKRAMLAYAGQLRLDTIL